MQEGHICQLYLLKRQCCWSSLWIWLAAKKLVLLYFFYLIACNDGDVRLVGGNSPSEGTIEVCFENLWGLVAESGWTQSDAEVVCKQLGYSAQGIHV